MSFSTCLPVLGNINITSYCRHCVAMTSTRRYAPSGQDYKKSKRVLVLQQATYKIHGTNNLNILISPLFMKQVSIFVYYFLHAVKALCLSLMGKGINNVLSK